MDTPAKRRSLFGGVVDTFFGRSQSKAPEPIAEKKELPRPTESQNTPQQEDQGATETEREHNYRKVDASNTPPVPRTDRPDFESPVKRATASQLSSRRILGRPQGPSSKLSQSVNASDLAPPRPTNFSSIASSSMSASRPMGAPIRMPGDNPNKYNTISGSNFGSRSTRPSADFSTFLGTATTPRNLFKASSVRGRPDFSFSPKVPKTTASQSFPPTTPGKPPRGSTADFQGRSLAHANSSILFEMRIPSPPRDLTGERLAKEMPEDKNRVGSIYASEFLAHYCPPDFDDLQRRQFFCVLDLRRLKYAADEVFTKKDWKINILNFAKEYEKSRSLIMLRYGLYEFKTVKASQAVTKQWKKDNGIPLSEGEEDEEEEQDEAPRRITNGPTSVAGGKRKAEEQLVPNDGPAKSSNPNKRTVTEQARERLDETPLSATSTPKPKRKADDLGESDENPPSKLQKAAPTPKAAITPSTFKTSVTKSIFESIANGTPKETSKETSNQAPKPGATSIFAKPLPNPTNPFGSAAPAAGKSVFSQKSLAPATNNIFGHLSDTSKASSNDADEESDSDEDTSADTDGEAHQSEAQGATPSDSASIAASGSVSMPQFGFQGTLSAPKDSQPVSSASSDAGGSSQGRSLFDRITKDANGEPVRIGQSKEATPQPTPSDNGKSTTPPTDQGATPAPAPAPANKTWTTGTPIKFAPVPSQPAQSISLFASATSKPNGTLFGQTSEAPKAAPAITLEPPTPAKESTKPATPAEEPKQPPAASQSIFGGPSSVPTTSSLFGSNTGSTLFGAKSAEEKRKDDAPASTTASLFGSKPASPSPAPEAAKPAANPFSSATPATSESATPKPAASPLFGAKPATTDAPTSIFAQKPAATEAGKPASVFQSSNLFGNLNKPTESKSPSPQPTSNPFGGAPKPAETSTSSAPATTGFSFGASAPAASTAAAAPAQSNLFSSTATPSSNLFAASKPAASPIFGGAPASSTPTPGSPMFGASPATQNEPTKQSTNIFANPPSNANPFGGNAAPTTPSFGATQSTVPSNSFGASAPQQNTQSQGSIFGNVGSGGASFQFNPQAQTTSFNMPTSTPTSFNFGATNNGNAAPPTTPFSFGAGPTISFGGASDTSAPASTQPSNMFGGGPNGSTSFGGSSSFNFSGTQAQQPGGGSNMFGGQPAGQATNMFTAGGLAPSTGTNTPLFGGASSMATTPASGTPEPTAGGDQKKTAVVHEGAKQETQADGDDAPQEQQISLLEGVLPGEESEEPVHEVRAKALKFEKPSADGDSPAKPKSASPWVTKGLGPLRLLKNKETGKVRMLLRAAPGGNIVLNKSILPSESYKSDDSKYVKVTTADDSGKGLETWMLQVKTKEAAKALADALEEHKTANAKKD